MSCGLTGAVRSQKQLDLVGDTPSYEPLEGFQRPDATARAYQHSSDGKLFAYAVPTACVRAISPFFWN